ncbi:hypothetical protein [Paraburkholderia phosphatilytica]|uniref:hypothetical protein n=1 Tax=Paraburkholderia phosphatilytica TaxID=2282883 RepID=UPI000E51836D|nr:hypothetical protein [Paraburkholderia phosphatilytica]
MKIRFAARSTTGRLRTLLLLCAALSPLAPFASLDAHAAAVAGNGMPGQVPVVARDATTFGPEFEGADLKELERRLKVAGLYTTTPVKQSVVKELLEEHGDREKLAAANVPETAFVVPLSRGVLYDRDRHRLSIEADLSDEGEDDIVLAKTVKGKSGYRLTVAPDAEKRGFIQKIDIAGLVVAHADSNRTLSLSTRMDEATFGRTQNSLAVALVGHLIRPFMLQTDARIEPSDDDPTLKFIHRTTLYYELDGAWLFDTHTGEVLDKGVKLTK